MWFIDTIAHLEFPPALLKIIYIAVTAATAWLIATLLRMAMGRYISKRMKTNPRASTIAGLLRSVVAYLVLLVAAFQILVNGFGIEPAILLGGVSVVGVAVGFGAQTLVKDIISGLFFLIEQQFSVGDLVTIEGFTGTVWELGLRSTTLSSGAGDRFTVPNGSIGKVVNHSRLTRGIAVRCEVSYDTHLPEALAALEKIAKAAFAEAGTLLLEQPAVSGVTKLGERGVTLQIFCKCAPGNEFALERDMLQRVKTGLDAAGITIAQAKLAALSAALLGSATQS
jgi:Small-conductance mechanosensitive channel